MKSEEIANEIIELYKKHGRENYIGEAISQIEHMSQSAQLAKEDGCDDEMILAAFFHDIGHICANENAQHMGGKYGLISHEDIGADYLLQKGFSRRIANLVQSHVDAKRYLCFKYPDYENSLSEASRQTLKYQGGPMNMEEASAFEKDPDFNNFLKMREYDDKAKLVGIPIRNLEFIEKKIIEVLNHSFDKQI